MRVDVLYVSDLVRARETAAAVEAATGLEATVDAELREVDVGVWAGCNREQARERDPEWYRRWADGVGRAATTAARRTAQLQRRSVRAFLRITDAADGRTAVIVCHGGNIRAIVSRGGRAHRRRALAGGRRRQLQPDGDRAPQRPPDPGHAQRDRVTSTRLRPDGGLHVQVQGRGGRDRALRRGVSGRDPDGVLPDRGRRPRRAERAHPRARSRTWPASTAPAVATRRTTGRPAASSTTSARIATTTGRGSRSRGRKAGTVPSGVVTTRINTKGRPKAAFRSYPGDDLLSQALAHQVPSALRGLTSLFGMGRGVSPSL